MRPSAVSALAGLGLAILAVMPAAAAVQTISCKNTKVPAERLVCDTPALAQIDRAHLALYRSVANRHRSDNGYFNTIKQAEIAIRVKRDACGANATCIRSVYVAGDSQIRSFDQKR